VTGDWSYDDGSTSTGTWWFEDDYSWIGSWATDESNDTIKYDNSDYEEYTCSDLDNGLVNSGGYACEWYWEAWGECDYMNTDTFDARELCCACYGGLNETLGHEGDNCLTYNTGT
jgi:hypothetical protein